MYEVTFICLPKTTVRNNNNIIDLKMFYIEAYEAINLDSFIFQSTKNKKNRIIGGKTYDDCSSCFNVIPTLNNNIMDVKGFT